MNLYFIGIIALLLSGFVAKIFEKNLKTKVLTTLVTVGSILCAIPAVKTLITGGRLVQNFVFDSIFGNVTFTIDTFSAFFILIITIMCTLSVVYSNGYLKPYSDSKNLNSHLIFLPTLIASMLAVVTCQNALMF